jgi:hypothetical protein
MELSHPPGPPPACLIATAPANLHVIRACAVSLSPPAKLRQQFFTRLHLLALKFHSYCRITSDRLRIYFRFTVELQQKITF